MSSDKEGVWSEDDIVLYALGLFCCAMTKVRKVWIVSPMNDPPVIASCFEVTCWSTSFFVFVLPLSGSNLFACANVVGGAEHGDCFSVLDRTERSRAQHPWLS